MSNTSSNATYIFTWNPRTTAISNYNRKAGATKAGGVVRDDWSTGNTKSIESGSRFFLLRQVEDRGIVGAGITTSSVWLGRNWKNHRKRANYVDIAFDQLLPTDDLLSVEDLKTQVDFDWDHLYASGVEVKGNAVKQLERLWARHLYKVGRLDSSPRTNGPLSTDGHLTTDHFIEGAMTANLINVYERNKKARNACLRHFGKKCAVCGFDPTTVYGDLGTDLIHVHHLKELASSRRPRRVDPIKDLRPICPNCHAAIHAKTPAFSIKQLQAIMKRNAR